MRRKLRNSELSHLRRLVGWVSCEIGQSPDDLVSTVQNIVSKTGIEISECGKSRLIDSHRKAESVPKYVRAAIKALRKTIAEQEGDIIDIDPSAIKSKKTKEVNKYQHKLIGRPAPKIRWAENDPF